MLLQIQSDMGDVHYILTENILRVRRASYNKECVVITPFMWGELFITLPQDWLTAGEFIDSITPYMVQIPGINILS